ncbi:low molecular weight phosphatase family protein [Microbacterium sp. W1N]|uniref:arsenate reductase/protein-tyrosine-phosphatase family protein n=1 Tax=Microbacterium festucae TaxID=2977531 RepID=UPI0021C0427C|nr:low molecular weight phosphatase family protein [Microbacterium festucae]MCT9819023.1 low molecular weight phosphatase family protein [Microbacterium festucae]
MELMTVCTGNICRSPLAELLLATRLGDLGVTVHSAGVRGLDAATMTPEAIDLALELGVSEADADAHRSRYLTEAMLTSPDLLLAMTRDHRREIAELAPSRLRSTFTVREFARLAASLSDDALVSAAEAAGPDPSARLRAAAATVAGMRGLTPSPADPADDDVIDPYRRSWETYQLSAQQLVPALAQVERVVRLAAA